MCCILMSADYFTYEYFNTVKCSCNLDIMVKIKKSICIHKPKKVGVEWIAGPSVQVRSLMYKLAPKRTDEIELGFHSF
jgi:hypothetical protein